MALTAPTAGTLALAAFSLLMVAAEATAQVGGDAFGLSGDQPVQVDGDRLEVLDSEGIAIFEGNVRVVQGDTLIRTARLVIHYMRDGASGGPQSQIERLEASGGINIQSEGQTATGENATYNMTTETLTLSGDRVTLSDGENVATGCRLTVDVPSGRSRLDGCADSTQRPTVLIQPQDR